VTTPLSDPDNVMFFVVENYVRDDEGFTDDEVQRILNGQPLTASAVTDSFEANEDKYDGGGMIALVPSDADLDRLTLDGEEPRDDLHLTLWYLGDDALDPQQREDVLRHTVTAVEEWYPIEGNAFGVALWNPTSAKPAWVLNVGDASDETTDDGSSNLTKIRGQIWQQVSEDFVFPRQHTPWQPHICIAYSVDDLADELRERLGPVTFDKVRVAYGRDNYDIELTGGVKFDFPVVAAADRNQLKDYWTKDPRGLAKWVDDPHPWTALYNHLKKHMPNEMAKRAASEWYHEVKGHWPSEKRGK
jgi:2'-5' RNA ligase